MKRIYYKVLALRPDGTIYELPFYEDKYFYHAWKNAERISREDAIKLAIKNRKETRENRSNTGGYFVIPAQWVKMTERGFVESWPYRFYADESGRMLKESLDCSTYIIRSA